MPFMGSLNVILQIETELPKGLPSLHILESCINESVKTVLDIIGQKLPQRDVELGIILTNDNEIRIINRTHRNIDQPTDVLSFPLISEGEYCSIKPSDGPPVVLGDIIISMETVERQACERLQNISERFAECLVHGLLHLMGWEHSTEDSRLRMEEIEDYILPKVISIFPGH